VLIVLLGVLHAWLYALVMPPWGLLDEHQHFHYVQLIAQEGRAPVLWRDRLSEEIVDSVFAVQRHVVTLGAESMPTREELTRSEQIFEGYSYEGLQPPLYYAILAPFYPLGPPDVLGKLFILRSVGVLLSGITLVLVWVGARRLWPASPFVAVTAALFVALLPERAASAGRLNNDLLVEITCAGVFAGLAWAWSSGTTWRRAVLVGLCLGLGILTKLSVAVVLPAILLGWVIAGMIHHRPWPATLGQTAAILALALVCIIPVVVRNLLLYGEPTGVNAFIARVGPFVAGPLSERVVTGAVDLVRNSWAVVWDGDRVVTKPSAAFLQLGLVTITALVVYAPGRAWTRHDERVTPVARCMLVTGCAALGLVGALTLFGYVEGSVPWVQGRFLLPALLPSAWAMGFGLWLLGRRWRGLAATLLVSLSAVLSLSVLFFHALPKFYAPRGTGFLGYWEQTRYLLFDPHGVFWDKPAFVNRWTVGLIVLAGVACAVALCVLLWRRYGSPLTAVHWQAARQFLRSQQLSPAAGPTAEFTSPADDGTMAIGSDRAAGRRTGTRLRLLRDPLFWTAIALLMIYLAWTAFYPAEIFWSLDEGGKYLHLQSIVQSGDLAAPLAYPGRFLDTDLQFVPLMHWSRAGDQVYSWWPVGFQLATLPFYLAFGWRGVYVLPALGGVLTALLAGLLVRQVLPRPGWAAWGTTLIVGLATPVMFYSTTFWEHTLSVALLMGALLATLAAWRAGRWVWLLAAGPLLALATYLRSDMAAMAVGMCLALLLMHWRWSVVLGVAYGLSGVPFVLANWILMGHPLGRQFVPGGAAEWKPLFHAVQDAGIWFIPYVLFNSSRVGGFGIDAGLLAVATLCAGVALLYPLLGRWRWASLVAGAGLLVVSGRVLLDPEGYRSVHGFVLIAPQVVLAAWLYRSRTLWRTTPFPRLLLAVCVVYSVVYVARAWIPAGGLQWGPRYQLAFYPLLVTAATIGLGLEWQSAGRWLRRGTLALFLVAVLVGVGYQVRGLLSARQTRSYYQTSEQALYRLPSQTLVTGCPWLTMVMPRLYWTNSVYWAGDETAFGGWVNVARRAGVHAMCRVEMDMCSTTPLDQIATIRAANPSGIEARCYAE
jgi:hypothetical protein